MSMQGCIAVEAEMKKLKALIEKAMNTNSTEVILNMVIKHVDETIAAAKSGWL